MISADAQISAAPKGWRMSATSFSPTDAYARAQNTLGHSMMLGAMANPSISNRKLQVVVKCPPVPLK